MRYQLLIKFIFAEVFDISPDNNKSYPYNNLYF